LEAGQNTIETALTDGLNAGVCDIAAVDVGSWSSKPSENIHRSAKAKLARRVQLRLDSE
jgi:hypothetical protein